MIKILLSRRLGELRWSQKDLSNLTGIRPGTISDYYWNEAAGIKLEHLDQMCKVLHCGLTDLLEFIPDDSETTQDMPPKQRQRRKYHEG